MRPPTSPPKEVGCQAMRRSGSNSITSLVIVYGRKSVSGLPRILIANRVPSSSGIDSASAWSTVPEPSKLACLPASASSAKISRGCALMTRSTLTVSPCTPSLSDLEGHHAPAPLGHLDAACDRADPFTARVGGEHLGG